jgi:hypothetical protein
MIRQTVSRHKVLERLPTALLGDGATSGQVGGGKICVVYTTIHNRRSSPKEFIGQSTIVNWRGGRKES